MTLQNRNWIIFLLAIVLLSGCSAFKKEEDPTATAEEMYAAAKKSLGKKNWNTAVEQLRKLEAKYPYGVYAEQAQIDTIYAYYRNSETGLAVAAADRFIRLHPTHPSVDYAYYLKGLSSYQEKDSTIGRLAGKDDLSDRDANLTRNALNAFKDVHTLFPESRYAADSRARSRYLYDALARHELAVASYYLSRDAYVAVVNRAKGVIENYDSTPSVETALAMLVFSYRQMGLNDLSDDAIRILKLNYPESRNLGENGRVRIGDKWYSPDSSGKGEKKRGFFSSIFKKPEKKPSS